MFCPHGVMDVKTIFSDANCERDTCMKNYVFSVCITQSSSAKTEHTITTGLFNPLYIHHGFVSCFNLPLTLSRSLPEASKPSCDQGPNPFFGVNFVMLSNGLGLHAQKAMLRPCWNSFKNPQRQTRNADRLGTWPFIMAPAEFPRVRRQSLRKALHM